MADTPAISKKLSERIAAVTNKRARFVLDSIVKKGMVTTEEINQAGYEHPPRAARDVRELGFLLKTIKVKHSNGRSIAAYIFGEGELHPAKAGRRILPKTRRDAIIAAAKNMCQVCSAKHNLQVDHCIPYEVAGEPKLTEKMPYQVLCGSCNRKKSWDCEHCQNWLHNKKPKVCRSCYWANPTTYTHIAMRQERRADLIWNNDEINDFEMIQKEASLHHRSVSEQIKQTLKKR